MASKIPLYFGRNIMKIRTSMFILSRPYSVSRILSASDQVNKYWGLGKLNHVAIAVPDIDKASQMYRDVLGAKVSEKHAQPEHGVYTVFVELGETKLELIHPLGDESPITKFLEKNPSGGLHHICLEVSDLEAAIENARAQGIRTLWDHPRIGAHGKPVIFLHPKDCLGTLTELEQI